MATSQQDLQQQQAQVSSMFMQLPPEQQAQIQEVVGAYNQQLSVQGVAPEAVQSYVWSYYTQCVSSFYQQLIASREESEKAEKEAKEAPRQTREELKALQRELDEELRDVQVPQKQSPKHVPKSPTTQPALVQQQPQSANELQQNSRSQSEVDDSPARPNFVDPQQHGQKHFEQKIDPALAKRFAKQREKENIPDQELVVEESRHVAEQKMDPVLAKRFAKQREKEETLDPLVHENHTASAPSAPPAKNIDPVLAKRWSAMQEKEKEGVAEDRSKSIEEAVSKQRQDKSKEQDSELAKRWAQRGENLLGDVDLYSAKKAEGVPSAESELAKRMAKQQEKIQERVEKFGEVVEPKPWEKRQAEAQVAASSELASRLAKQQEKAKLAENEAEATLAADTEGPDGPPKLVQLDDATRLEADRKRLALSAGKTATHKYVWPTGLMSVSSLRWHAVVLEGLTVDLEVTALLQPDGSEAEIITLQKNARGQTFEGTFAPQRDKRLLLPESAVVGDAPANDGVQSRGHRLVQAVVFRFSNTFSWFNAKDVELVIVPSD